MSRMDIPMLLWPDVTEFCTEDILVLMKKSTKTLDEIINDVAIVRSWKRNVNDIRRLSGNKFKRVFKHIGSDVTLWREFEGTDGRHVTNICELYMYGTPEVVEDVIRRHPECDPHQGRSVEDKLSGIYYWVSIRGNTRMIPYLKRTYPWYIPHVNNIYDIIFSGNVDTFRTFVRECLFLPLPENVWMHAIDTAVEHGYDSMVSAIKEFCGDVYSNSAYDHAAYHGQNSTILLLKREFVHSGPTICTYEYAVAGGHIDTLDLIKQEFPTLRCRPSAYYKAKNDQGKEWLRRNFPDTEWITERPNYSQSELSSMYSGM